MTGPTKIKITPVSSSNFDTYQSAYHAGHSTEMALLEVFLRVLSATGDKKLTVLIGLVISSAFDMIDHNIMLCRPHGEFRVTGTALAWLQSCRSFLHVKQ